MSSNRWTCSRKRPYPSYKQARKALLAIRWASRADDTLHVYRCDNSTEDSPHFHLGHARKADDRARLVKRAERRRARASA